MDNLTIRKSLQSDLKDVMKVEEEAFASEEEAQLVGDLLVDESAKPLISLLAFVEEEAVGHILFTRSTIVGHENSVLTHILAPLAVKPDFQSRGIGSKLIHEGFKQLTQLNTALVFVLGHPEYYPKFGFLCNAESMGYPPTYPIPKENANAWMVKYLTNGAKNKFTGKVICADAMNKSEYWRE